MIDLVIDRRERDIGGFTVGRLLPFTKRRMVGPFIFLDHMGPLDLAPGLDKSATCARTRTSDRRSPTSSTARSCTATASAHSRRSVPAR
jgi:hypothetical protein